MEQYQLEANEQFFDHLINVLTEGGTWAWPDTLEIYTKQGDKLLGGKEGLEYIKDIVRQDYFQKRFSLKK